MLDIISGIILGISAYISTNIDNLFILLTIHSDRYASKIRVLSGYAAWVVLMLASMLVFSLVRDFIPVNFLELLGIIPLLVGLQKLYTLFREKEDKNNQPLKKPAADIGALAVLTILTANSGDTLTVFVPLIMESELMVAIIIGAAFILISCLWYIISIRIVRHSFVSDFTHRYGKYIVPFAMMAIGIYILSNSGTDLL